MMRFSGRPLIFGEVLFDCFADGSRVLGGAPFNVAWNLQALGLAPLFVSRIGNDPAGEEVRKRMRQWGLCDAALQQDSRHATGRVEVRLVENEPVYEIVTETAWDQIDADELPTQTPALLYHGTLSARSHDSARALACLRRRPAPIFVDVNLRPPWWCHETVLELLQGARWIKLNRGELDSLLPSRAPLAEQGRQLLKICPQAELLLVTDGEKGGLALTAAGESLLWSAPPQCRAVDTVGAGDAFASVAILGLLSGWPLPLLLERAQQFAAALVGVRGATLNDPGFYQTFRRIWSHK